MRRGLLPTFQWLGQCVGHRGVGREQGLLTLPLRVPVCALTGWPPLTWLVIDGKHLTKPPKDWHPAMQDAGPQTAYIEVVPSRAPRSGTSMRTFPSPQKGMVLHPEPPLLPPWGPPAPLAHPG